MLWFFDSLIFKFVPDRLIGQSYLEIGINLYSLWLAFLEDSRCAINVPWFS